MFHVFVPTIHVPKCIMQSTNIFGSFCPSCSSVAASAHDYVYTHTCIYVRYIYARDYGCTCADMCMYMGVSESCYVSLPFTVIKCVFLPILHRGPNHSLISWEKAGGLTEKELNETPIPLPSHKTSKAGHGGSGTKLWISDSICSLCSLGLAPAGLLSPHGLELGSPRCPESMSIQPLVRPHCPVLEASEMKSIHVLLPNLSRVSPIPLRSEATAHLFSDSPYDINVLGGKFQGPPILHSF